MSYQQPSRRDDFEIAIICALPIEYDAVSYIFDEFWDEIGDQYGRAAGDQNTYTTGRVGKYDVVLALLPHMGKANAASTAASLCSSYGGLQVALLVGVCGGVPYGRKGEILLGDVVVSKTLIQYDFGRQYPDKFVCKNTIDDSLGRPNKNIRSLLALFETDLGLKRLEARTAYFLQQLQANAIPARRQGKYDYPGPAEDRLFNPTYRHKHYRSIASDLDVIAFEMEGAGVWEEMPCIVVKGVCDYADSHKHKGWQDYAAATAASASKAILERYIRPDKSMDASTGSAREEDRQREERRREVEQLLQRIYTSPYKDRKDRSPERTPGTCEWFTSHRIFQNWHDSTEASLLWVSADPGCGKSVLAKHLVDTVLPSTDSRTTCYFFFKDDFNDQRSPAGALCCILRQIFIQKPALLSISLLKRFREDGMNLLQSFQDLWDIFISIASHQSAGEIICILDALDECEESEGGGRTQIAGALSELYAGRTRTFTLKILLTSRPYIHIQRNFQSLEDRVPTIHLHGEDETEVNKIQREIDIVIRSRLDDLSTRLKLLPEERQVLQEELTRVPNRTYLWVHLICDFIKNSIIISPSTLHETIEQQVNDRAFFNYSAKYWAAHMRIADVKDDEAMTQNMLRLCDAQWQGFFPWFEVYWTATRKSNSYPEHLTPLIIASFFGLRDAVCLLLGAGNFDIDAIDEVYGRSALSWAARNGYEDVVNLLLRKRAPVRMFWKLRSKRSMINKKDKSGIMPIRLAVQEGHAGVMKLLLDTGKVDLKDQHNQSLLFLATKNCHEAIVKLLLDTGKIDPDSKDDYEQRTPISYASQYGHVAIVKLLLDTGKVDPESKDDDEQRTPISYAAENGHGAIVKLLLDTGKADPDSMDDDKQRTPISYAAQYGHEAIVKLLLDTGKVDPDSKDQFKWTPIFYASQYGHVAIVKLLLDTGKVDPDSKDNYEQRTPISYASQYGHIATTKLLLDTGKVDPDSKGDYKKRTPISYAAHHGHGAIVKLLLDTGKVDPDSKDQFEWTPIFYASQYGHVAIVKLLLETGKVNPNSKDDQGYTLVSYAAPYGHEAIVKLLLNTGKVHANSKDQQE
ncbi:hypothetical protein G7Z17_g1435 [Cylindrodendrum hubeiense]|uniref:Uncharacterized protein n=1 Tax=Cylindrodendrum hubeiense TaxID=595255 RepID=A0A9P5HES3_9HYPO|nr:hypothetical protein G7Z17_g1435 [Cylindrodendrum hubeiense]